MLRLSAPVPTPVENDFKPNLSLSPSLVMILSSTLFTDIRAMRATRRRTYKEVTGVSVLQSIAGLNMSKAIQAIGEDATPALPWNHFVLIENLVSE